MPHPQRHTWIVLCLAALASLAVRADGVGTVRVGDLEMHCEALSSGTLPIEAAREFNVTPDPRRALLLVTIVRHLGPGLIQTQPAQVFAGAIDSRNALSNIPLREMRRDDAVYYLGEFRIAPPDTLRFLVNANTTHGRILKVDFSQSFTAP
ncbi:MAG TPA: DUF4426 domain-containing protein [Thiobacillaceae bacterium]|nr:DUF4426 domain-containing protein [Thiobacillaceae bacterium]HNU63385.1 DUF4426 domain-containing protein [Thiobacillaceae bacterium]